MSNQITLFPLFLSQTLLTFSPHLGPTENGLQTRPQFNRWLSALMGRPSSQLETRSNHGIWRQRSSSRFALVVHLPRNVDFQLLPSMQKWRGHTTAVRGLAFTPQSTSFVSFAAEDRFVDIWSTQNAENENVLAALALDNNPIMVDTHAPSADRPTVLFILDFFFFLFLFLRFFCFLFCIVSGPPSQLLDSFFRSSTCWP